MYTVEKKNNKTETNWYDGVCYDSCKEAGHARLLDRMLEKGEITSWKRQVHIDFFIEQRDGVPVLVVNPDDRRYTQFLCRYYLDFEVLMPDGTIELQEVKGLQGKDWLMKWKMLESVYGHDHPVYSLKVIR